MDVTAIPNTPIKVRTTKTGKLTLKKDGGTIRGRYTVEVRWW